MRRFLTFLIVGSFFATVEEFLTVVVIKRDLSSYLFTLLFFFPTFLAFVYLSSHLLGRLIPRQPLQDIAHFFLYGSIGLLIEWFVIGLAPWSDPNAQPLIMAVFQLGMFSFWASVAFAPRLFISSQELPRRTIRSALRFFVAYFTIVYVVAFTVPEQVRFTAIISLIIFGYLVLSLYWLRYFRRSFALFRRSDSTAT